jgi:ArsR family transcriptional regulator
MSAVQNELTDQVRLEMEELVSNMCMALNDPKRLMVIWALSNGAMSVGEISTALGLPQANVSQHLAILRTRGLVDTERKGNSIFYTLRYPRLVEAVDMLRGVLREEIARRNGLLGSD